MNPNRPPVYEKGYPSYKSVNGVEPDSPEELPSKTSLFMVEILISIGIVLASYLVFFAILLI